MAEKHGYYVTLPIGRKGLLKTNKIGRRNEYTAIVTEADYQATQAKALLDKLYEGDAKGLVSTLIQREMLTATDYEELKKVLGRWKRQ